MSAAVSHTSRATVLALCVLVGVVTGCGRTMPTIRPTSAAPATQPHTEAVLATTDAVRDSGLADALKAAFQQAYPQYGLKVVSGTTSEVLALGKSGQAAVLLVDAPAKATTLVASGEASQSKAVMEADFVLVGPTSDPASAHVTTQAVTAMKAIAAAKATFVSAGGVENLSGAEAALWASAGVSLKGKAWHLTAANEADALRTANAKGGYTLVERADWLAGKSGLTGSAVLVQGDKALADPYVAVLVKGAANPAEAQVLESWISGPAAQLVIGALGVRRFGQSIFNANAL